MSYLEEFSGNDDFTNLVIAGCITTKSSTAEELSISHIPYYSAESIVISEFWNNSEKFLNSSHSKNSVPANTVFCDDLTIEKIIR